MSFTKLTTAMILAGCLSLITIGCTNSTTSNPSPSTKSLEPQSINPAPIVTEQPVVESPRSGVPVKQIDDQPAIPPPKKTSPAPTVSTANPNMTSDPPSESRSQAVERLTDWFLNTVNPELNGRKLTEADQGYLSDREAIKIAVEREMINEQLDCGGDKFWDLRDYGPGIAKSKSLDRIADTIWASRDPVGANSRADVTREKRQALRASIIREPACY
jgi:hypothetical protein